MEVEVPPAPGRVRFPLSRQGLVVRDVDQHDIGDTQLARRDGFGRHGDTGLETFPGSDPDARQAVVVVQLQRIGVTHRLPVLGLDLNGFGPTAAVDLAPESSEVVVRRRGGQLDPSRLGDHAAGSMSSAPRCLSRRTRTLNDDDHVPDRDTTHGQCSASTTAIAELLEPRLGSTWAGGVVWSPPASPRPSAASLYTGGHRRQTAANSR